MAASHTVAAAPTAAAVSTSVGLEQLSKQQCIYTACYCEENVYHLLQHLIEAGGRPAESLFAVFISNTHETVSLCLVQHRSHS
jgi:hypothetical protein